MTNLPKKDLLNKVITYENIMDQEFLNMVMQEALRFQCPAVNNTPVDLL